MELRVSAVLLAAGSSRRMGTSKQFLPLGDKPVVRHCVDALLAAGPAELAVVAGPGGAELERALSGAPVNLVVNPNPDSDMAESVRAGLRGLREDCSGVLVGLADHPLVAAETIKALMLAHRASPEHIIIPAYDGRRGHPTLFPKELLKNIFSGITLRDIITTFSENVLLLPVRDEGVIRDMDVPEDYRSVLKLFGRTAGDHPSPSAPIPRPE